MTLSSFFEALTAGGKTALASTAIGCLGVLVYSVAVNQKTVYLTFAIITVAFISVLLGGLQGSLTAGTPGWLHGGVVAALYSCFIILAELLISPSLVYYPDNVLLIAGLLLTGMLGGVAGVNLRYIVRIRARRKYFNF